MGFSAEDDRDHRLLDELRFQLTVTRAMLESPHLDQVLHVILSGITHGEGLNFNRAVLFLTRERRGELRAVRATGPANKAEAHRIWESIEREELHLERLLAQYQSGAESDSLARRLKCFSTRINAAPKVLDSNQVSLEELVSWCAAHRQTDFSNDCMVSFCSPEGPPLKFEKVAVAPLVLREQIIGVILADNAYNLRDIEAGELRGLSTLANLAAIAIDRAQLNRRLEEMANRDGLTGVFNRRYYETRVTAELDRAQHTGRNIGMLVVDIDHFKSYNDRFGHVHGDRVLREVAQCLVENTRDEDIIARYGGEEFVVLVTGGKNERCAVKVAEKLREKIAARSFADRPAGELTVSIGLATTDGQQVDNKALFEVADAALYSAKERGRNQVVVGN